METIYLLYIPLSDYLRDRSCDEYIRGDYNINSESQYDEVGPLYTVSQRLENHGYQHDIDHGRSPQQDNSSIEEQGAPQGV